MSEPTEKRAKTGKGGKKQEKLAMQLGDRLAGLSEQAEGEVCFPAASLVTPDDLLRVRRALDTWGVVFLTGAVSESLMDTARTNLCESMWQMFGAHLPPGTPRPSSLSEWNRHKNAKTGFGNVGLGYVNKQYSERGATPVISVGGEDVFVTGNTVWRGVTIPLLCAGEAAHTLALLLSLSHPRGALSVDSAKYSSNPRPRPAGMSGESLTLPHVDLYCDSIARCQALIVDEQGVKLGFVPGSHLLGAEIAAAEGKNKAPEEGAGFVGIKDAAVHAALARGWLAPPPLSLVLWRSGVVHFEATCAPKSKIVSSPAFRFSSFSDTPNAERFRVVVGTHRPVNLSRSTLQQLAILAERGVIPDMYRGINSHNSLIWPNIVNRKSTLYLIPRVISDEERKMFREAEKDSHLLDASETWRLMSPLKRHLAGVSQSWNILPFSPADKALLMQFSPK